MTIVIKIRDDLEGSRDDVLACAGREVEVNPTLFVERYRRSLFEHFLTEYCACVVANCFDDRLKNHLQWRSAFNKIVSP